MRTSNVEMVSFIRLAIALTSSILEKSATNPLIFELPEASFNSEITSFNFALFLPCT